MPKKRNSKVVFAADLHLAPRIWVGRGSIAGDAVEAMGWLEQLVIDEEADLVLGGDVVDRNDVDASTLALLKGFMDKMVSKDVDVWHITGQHDKGRDGSTVAGVLGSHNLDQTCAELGGMVWSGLSWRAGRKATLDALAEVPESDALAVHAAFRHLLGFDGAWQLEGADIPDYIGMVCAGDIHVHDDRVVGMTRVLSPGSLYPRSSDEFSEGHGVWLFEDGEPRWIEHPCRGYATADLRGLTSSKAVEAVKEAAEGVGSGCPLPQVVAAIVDPGMEAPVVDGVVVVETRGKLEATEASAEGFKAGNLADAVAEASKEAPDGVEELALELLEEDDPVAVLDKWAGDRKLARVER